MRPCPANAQVCIHPKLLVDGNATAITAQVANFLPTAPSGGASGSRGGFGYGGRGGLRQKGKFLEEYSGCVRTRRLWDVRGQRAGRRILRTFLLIMVSTVGKGGGITKYEDGIRSCPQYVLDTLSTVHITLYTKGRYQYSRMQ